MNSKITFLIETNKETNLPEHDFQYELINIYARAGEEVRTKINRCENYIVPAH